MGQITQNPNLLEDSKILVDTKKLMEFIEHSGHIRDKLEERVTHLEIRLEILEKKLHEEYVDKKEETKKTKGK